MLFFSYLSFSLIFYFVGINAIHALLLIIGILKTFFRNKQVKQELVPDFLQSPTFPELAFIIPAYNEEKSILTTIHNISKLPYRYKQIIIVNDGSEDATLVSLQQELDLVEMPYCYYEGNIVTARIRSIYRSRLFSEIYVVDKENGKKFDAINAGLNLCTAQYFIVVDADTCINQQNFIALIRPIMSKPHSAAIGVSIRIKNQDPRNYLANSLICIQKLEYLRSFFVRLGLSVFRSNCIVAGACSIFPTRLVKDINGFYNTVGEDMEIVLRLHRVLKEKKIPYTIFYLPDPASWTQVPEQLKSLKKQRIRWYLGGVESIFHHKNLLFNPCYGLFGLFVVPFVLFGEFMEPLAELLGFILIAIGCFFGFYNIGMIALIALSVIIYVCLINTLCLMVDKSIYATYPDIRNPFLWMIHSVIEIIFYRQLNLIWQLQAFIRFLNRKDKNKTIQTALESVS